MKPTRPSRAFAAACIAALIIMGSGTAAAQTIADRHDSGAKALAAGLYLEAIEIYGAALLINANDLESTLRLAEAYYGLEEYDQAKGYSDRARMLAGRSPEVLTLSGRIAIGMGDLELAESLFSEAKSIEPNNSEAEIGLAELAIAEGRSLDAIQFLENALRYRPDSRKALLSLALVHERAGDLDVAERYLDTALRLHGNRPETHILAAEFDLRRGRTARAASRARTAQALDENSRAATRIRTTVSLLDGRYLEALASADELIRTTRTDAVAWYLRGQAQLGLGSTDDALASFMTALRYQPDLETIRLVAENLVMEAYPLDAEVRAGFSDVIVAQARRYQTEFRYSRALASYQRALRLNPLDGAIRRNYAELYRTLGFSATYLQELSVISETGETTPELERTRSIFLNQLSESVAFDWDVDQFTLPRSDTTLGIYLLNNAGTLRFPMSGTALLNEIVRDLSGRARLSVVDSRQVGDFTQAFSAARSQDVDFFVLLVAAETDRTMVLGGSVHVGRTGSEVTEISSARGGPDRVFGSIEIFGRRLEAIFPTRVRIVARRGDLVLLDAGVRDQLTADSELTVFEPASVLRSPNSLNLVYNGNDAIGTIAVTRLDDLVSEGLLETFGIVDRVVAGDVAISVLELAEDVQSAPSYPILYDRIRALR